MKIELKMRILTFCFLLDQVVLCAEIIHLYERLQNGYNIKIPGPGPHQSALEQLEILVTKNVYEAS